uniref:Citryl-CoA lyase n=1 Tax=uncultured prokaryote TaxID=198431 RepID=H5SPB5_9ZZZZ|nr:citryl-CoA lyase [uncultured prokaryote]
MIIPRRSVLYVPGSNMKMMEKASGLPADVVILDLEDAVAPEEKKNARALVRKALSELPFAGKERLVRINSFSSGLGRDDLEEVAESKPDGFVLPKVESPVDVRIASELLSMLEKKMQIIKGHFPLFLMIETPLGLLKAMESASSDKRVRGLIFGAADFIRQTGGRISSDRRELLYPMNHILIVARATGCIAIDAPYFNFRDEEGLRNECIQARSLGFDGKSVIHPSQIPIVNEIFSPTKEEIEFSLKVIEAFEDAQRKGVGVISIDGQMIENVHYFIAKKTIGLAKKLGIIPD